MRIRGPPAEGHETIPACPRADHAMSRSTMISIQIVGGPTILE